ncbi:hypothetical protein DBB36_00050 [Flavobacterium sp. WLB]|nr:hypothetical protein AKO67_15045 [Flavobacterium sp. VMW]OWU88445.1 hypothetical protein APR43_23145 [Flavobacterium sp. NLM]PUU72010.1 hypothetical protein DBB36_00050 [Flavobacterium sp. WLB]
MTNGALVTLSEVEGRKVTPQRNSAIKFPQSCHPDGGRIAQVTPQSNSTKKIANLVISTKERSPQETP